MTVEIQVQQSTVPDAMIRALSPEVRTDLHAAAAEALAEFVGAHIRSYAGTKHATAQSFGASPTRHYEDGAAHISTSADASAGTVTAVSPMSEGRFGLLIDHGSGVETVYAHLARVDVAAGDAVERGQALGVCAGDLYFEYRENGASVDPSEKLGLK